MNMRRLVLATTLAAALTLTAAPAATASHASPGGGAAFGEHVSQMAPECPIKHGRQFGECVSGMASGECPHNHHE